MISNKIIPADTILNRKKNIMDILLTDINYTSKKITYQNPYDYKIKKIKIKKHNFFRNVNNLKKKDKKCIDIGYERDIIIEDIPTDNENFMILPNNEIRKNIYGEPVVIDLKNNRYDKDILLYKYDAGGEEEEQNIDTLIQNIMKEIQDMDEDIYDLTDKYLDFLDKKETKDEYIKYKRNELTGIYKDLYKSVDLPFENIINKYDEIIEKFGL